MSRLNLFHFCTTIALACALVLPAAISLADTYRWIDKNGVEGFADSLQKVPPEYRDSAKRVEKGGKVTPGPLQVVPSPHPAPMSPTVNPEAEYQQWRDRLRGARAELEDLKTQREQAQKEYETSRAEFYVRSFGNPEADARYRARIAELDEQISQKEEEINTTIPDEARRAGIPPGILNQ